MSTNTRARAISPADVAAQSLQTAEQEEHVTAFQAATLEPVTDERDRATLQAAVMAWLDYMKADEDRAKKIADADKLAHRFAHDTEAWSKAAVLAWLDAETDADLRDQATKLAAAVINVETLATTFGAALDKAKAAKVHERRGFAKFGDFVADIIRTSMPGLQGAARNAIMRQVVRQLPGISAGMLADICGTSKSTAQRVINGQGTGEGTGHGGARVSTPLVDKVVSALEASDVDPKTGNPLENIDLWADLELARFEKELLRKLEQVRDAMVTRGLEITPGVTIPQVKVHTSSEGNNPRTGS